jgi:CRP/FNR family transcriptional regulator, cyclic AMP receptor protein
MAIPLARLASIPFFKGLPEQILVQLASNLEFGWVEERSTVLRHGVQPNAIFILESGQLQVSDHASDGRVTGIRMLNPGDMFGHLSLIDGLPINCTVRAIKPSGLFYWTMVNAKLDIDRHPQLIGRYAKVLASDFRRSIADKGVLSVPNAYHRIFIHIHSLVNECRKDATTQLPNQKEIASVVNTSRETVSRALQLLIKTGVLVKSGHELTIHKADLLEKLAIDGLDALPTNH